MTLGLEYRYGTRNASPTGVVSVENSGTAVVRSLNIAETGISGPVLKPARTGIGKGHFRCAISPTLAVCRAVVSKVPNWCRVQISTEVPLSQLGLIGA